MFTKSSCVYLLQCFASCVFYLDCIFSFTICTILLFLKKILWCGELVTTIITDLRQVCVFVWLMWCPPPIKNTLPQYIHVYNIVESNVNHPNTIVIRHCKPLL